MSSSNNDSEMPSGTQLKIFTLVSAVGIGVFMSSMDASIVVVLLEQIQANFGVSPPIVQWVILSYLLTMMAFTVIAGDLGDRYSNKRIFQYG